MYEDCRALLRTEAQAYRAQNTYLRANDQLAYVGTRLNQASCTQ